MQREQCNWRQLSLKMRKFENSSFSYIIRKVIIDKSNNNIILMKKKNYKFKFDNFNV